MIRSKWVSSCLHDEKQWWSTPPPLPPCFASHIVEIDGWESTDQKQWCGWVNEKLNQRRVSVRKKDSEWKNEMKGKTKCAKWWKERWDKRKERGKWMREVEQEQWLTKEVICSGTSQLYCKKITSRKPKVDFASIGYSVDDTTTTKSNATSIWSTTFRKTEHSPALDILSAKSTQNFSMESGCSLFQLERSPIIFDKGVLECLHTLIPELQLATAGRVSFGPSTAHGAIQHLVTESAFALTVGSRVLVQLGVCFEQLQLRNCDCVGVLKRLCVSAFDLGRFCL
jgi:hypothetical protein